MGCESFSLWSTIMSGFCFGFKGFLEKMFRKAILLKVWFGFCFVFLFLLVLKCDTFSFPGRLRRSG